MENIEKKLKFLRIFLKKKITCKAIAIIRAIKGFKAGPVSIKFVAPAKLYHLSLLSVGGYSGVPHTENFDEVVHLHYVNHELQHLKFFQFLRMTENQNLDYMGP